MIAAPISIRTSAVRLFVESCNVAARKKRGAYLNSARDRFRDARNARDRFDRGSRPR
jgi:hypothetical protein